MCTAVMFFNLTLVRKNIFSNWAAPHLLAKSCVWLAEWEHRFQMILFLINFHAFFLNKLSKPSKLAVKRVSIDLCANKLHGVIQKVTKSQISPGNSAIGWTWQEFPTQEYYSVSCWKHLGTSPVREAQNQGRVASGWWLWCGALWGQRSTPRAGERERECNNMCFEWVRGDRERVRKRQDRNTWERARLMMRCIINGRNTRAGKQPLCPREHTLVMMSTYLNGIRA